jgi:hypothetical protein
MQNFPENQLMGLFANPIAIEDSDNEGVSFLQRSKEARRELVL